MNPSPSPPYPGEEEAQRLGYTLQSSNGANTRATYVKRFLRRPIYLTVKGTGAQQTARLEAHHGVVALLIDDFSFPNVNFPMFEKQLINILQKTAQKE